jgi:YD repeat-containing protein
VSYGTNPNGQRTSVTAPSLSIGYGYDAAGRMATMTDASGTTTFAYDRASRPLTVTLSLGGSVRYRYDDVGNRTQLILPRRAHGDL